MELIQENLKEKNILKSKKIKIGMAARFVNEKKQLLIIDTFIKNKIFFVIKYTNFFCWIRNIIKSIKKKVKENNLTRNIKFEGNLTENKLINWFNKIDVYFHLSEAETTSTAILQALSNSLPVFASKVQGNIQVSKYIGKNTSN